MAEGYSIVPLLFLMCVVVSPAQPVECTEDLSSTRSAIEYLKRDPSDQRPTCVGIALKGLDRPIHASQAALVARYLGFRVPRQGLIRNLNSILQEWPALLTLQGMGPRAAPAVFAVLGDVTASTEARRSAIGVLAYFYREGPPTALVQELMQKATAAEGESAKLFRDAAEDAMKRCGQYETECRLELYRR